MNPCPTPPVCEFGKYGCEAEYWGTEHVPDWHGFCPRCGETVEVYMATWCNAGPGGVFAMCGHRPLTASERYGSYTRGDRMGQRPEVDRVNVVPCGGAGDE